MGSCTACDKWASAQCCLRLLFPGTGRRTQERWCQNIYTAEQCCLLLSLLLILLILSLVQDFTVAKAYRWALLCCSPEQTLVFLALMKPVLRDEQRNLSSPSCLSEQHMDSVLPRTLHVVIDWWSLLHSL